MSRFELETWDDGRLIVNRAFADLLRRQDWTTFAAVWSRTADAAVAKKLRTDRITLRFTLDNDGQERAFYIKRHGRSSWKEYIKPLLSLRWPILGAKNEWNALLDFHEADLPTMTPVALGQAGANSFLVTEALEDCTKLSELRRGLGNEREESAEKRELNDADSRSSTRYSILGTRHSRRSLIERVARVAKRMHGAGLHHQDFYLGHLLLPNKIASREVAADCVYVIDLGRVRKQQPLASRWIVKDLAQLNYSARDVGRTDRLRFLREYLGRKIGPADKRLIVRIASKTASIARHSKKNSL